MAKEYSPENSPFDYLYNAPLTLRKAPTTRSFGFLDGEKASGHKIVLTGRDYDFEIIGVSHDENGKHVNLSVFPKGTEVDALWYQCDESGVGSTSEDQPFKVPDLYRKLMEAALSADSHPDVQLRKMRVLALFVAEQTQV